MRWFVAPASPKVTKRAGGNSQEEKWKDPEQPH